jgi:hypothetical protein
MHFPGPEQVRYPVPLVADLSETAYEKMAGFRIIGRMREFPSTKDQNRMRGEMLSFFGLSIGVCVARQYRFFSMAAG